MSLGRLRVTTLMGLGRVDRGTWVFLTRSVLDGIRVFEINDLVPNLMANQFSIITLVLLPVVNGILLDYVLQSLEDSGIQETFIFCCSHNQLIRSHVSSSRWSEPDASMVVNVISSSSFMSMGDIMRELDSKALIRSDFILINGDVITNLPLGSILDEHRKLRQKDKSCAITVLYREALPKHKTRCKEHAFVVAVESSSNKIRFYQRVTRMKLLNIPLEVFQQNDEVDIHYDLLDTHVSICSPCVPPLFSDNFDYQTVDDFIKGLLVNEELLGNSMYIHVAKSGYGASISNLYMYDAVSQDIMARWTYPIVPDLVGSRNVKFVHYRHNIYKEPNIEIGRNCNILKNVAISKGTKIGENTHISNSVIGRNCVIGDNVIIKGSHLWSDVVIGDGCHLDTCLLAENVALHKNVIINPGCILGNSVVLGDNVTLPPLSRLQAQIVTEDDSFGEDEFEDAKSTDDKACDVALVGANGLGYLCNPNDESDDDDDDDGVEDVWGRVDAAVSEDDDETDSSGSHMLEDDVGEVSDGGAEDYDDEATFFYNEVLESLQRGIEEKVKSENMILEINSSKHAYNISMKEVNTLVIKALLKLPLKTHKQEVMTPQLYLSTIKPSLQFLSPLVSNYIRSAESQLDCLSSVEEFMIENEKLCAAAMKVVHFWYDRDVLNEHVIMKWYRSIQNDQVKKQAYTFIKWLQEADEESSESDD